MKLCFWLRINSTFIPRHRVGLETCPKPSFENNSSKICFNLEILEAFPTYTGGQLIHTMEKSRRA